MESWRVPPLPFGILTFRTRRGRYVRCTSSSRSGSSLSTPSASIASNVTPSMPGAPSFSLANRLSQRSRLQTCTYNPQKRQDGSAFALTYSLRLRSCSSMGARASADAATVSAPVIGGTLLPPISRSGRGRLLQLLSMPLSPCYPYYPAEGRRLISQSATPPAAVSEGSAFGAFPFRGHLWVHFRYGPVRSPS